MPWSNTPDPVGTTLLRHRAGLGYQEQNAPVSQRSLNPDALDGEPHSSKQVMVLVWNAGNLERRVRLDGLNDFAAGNFHIGLLQESAGTRLPNILQSRAIAFNYLPDGAGGNLCVTAGGSGLKAMWSLYADFNGEVPRPWTPNPSTAAVLHGCGISWVDANGAPVPRAGLDVWKVATIHYDHDFAKKPDSVKFVLASVFKLLFRDQVRLVGGDFNRAAAHLPGILEAVIEGTSVQYQIFQAPGSDEVVAILFNYERLPVLQAEMRTAISDVDKQRFGLTAKDRDTHCPMILCVEKADVRLSESRSSWHTRSAEAQRRRNKAKHQRASEKRRDKRRKRKHSVPQARASAEQEEEVTANDESSEPAGNDLSP